MWFRHLRGVMGTWRGGGVRGREDKAPPPEERGGVTSAEEKWRKALGVRCLPGILPCQVSLLAESKLRLKQLTCTEQ